MDVAEAPKTFEDIPVLHPPTRRLKEVLALPDSQRTKVIGNRKSGSTVPCPCSSVDRVLDYESRGRGFDSLYGYVEIAQEVAPKPAARAQRGGDQ